MNMAEVSRSAGIPHSTLRRYLALLEALFIVQPLPAWSANLGKRLVKAPKVHLLDSGLAANLQGQTDPDTLLLFPHLGALLETFAVQELRRHLSWARTAASKTTPCASSLCASATAGRGIGTDCTAAVVGMSCAVYIGVAFQYKPP